MTGHIEVLEPWVEELLTALEIEGTPIDIEAVLDLAGEAAHQIVRPAAPVTTFIVGYAAGLAAATDQATSVVAMKAASGVASRLCAERAERAGNSAESPAAEE
ncbi:DUF6457 domain-containing protein [Arthrobacter roseus]|uniref:DUF6457 domain-containing protein n=1 Tax=Arthrobacter roseus TaxID=136274 RepID=UPI0019647644|nr:DUF6457 domain-containing protein [Arthrobacter roseus]MBM7847760.1 hypothetical protein [Arthrobacter roseus]